MQAPSPTDPTTGRPRLAVVIPLCNEEPVVPELLRRVTAQIDDDDVVFCIVDQSSRDRTRAAVEAFGELDARVVCVWAPENRCVVDAYFSGYRAAYDSGARWVLEMDGGLSHLPEDIPRFIEAMESGAQFAAGSRCIADSGWQVPLSRRVLSQGGTLLANLVLGTEMKDMTSGFECFDREAMRRVLDVGVMSRAHFFQTEIRAEMHSFKWVEIPITYSTDKSVVAAENVGEALRNLMLLRRRMAKQRAVADE